MHRRHENAVAGVAIVVGLFATAWAAPVAAAGCTLSAPATVVVGSPFSIDGTGFPTSATVDIKLTLDGGTPDAFSIASDATGAFAISLTPELADVGTTTVVAISGSACRAQVRYTTATSMPASPTSAPSALPESSPGQPAPRTDALRSPGRAQPGFEVTTWIGFLIVVIGACGLVITRRIQDRQDRA